MTTQRPGVSHSRSRLSFAKLEDAVSIPNLIETQQKSYEDFLQLALTPNQKRTEMGLQSAFMSIFPITTTSSSGDSATLEFVEYIIGKPKYTIEECFERGMTYAAPLKVKFQLIVREMESTTGSKHIKDIKEQEIYLGEIPLMTKRGTFIINGAERVIVSQLHRSPGVTFSEERHSSGRPIYYARVIPTRGAWLEFEIDANDRLYVSIDRRRKFYATSLLRSFGRETDEEILTSFYKIEKVKVGEKEKPPKQVKVSELEDYLEHTLEEDVIDPADASRKIARAGDRISPRTIAHLQGAGMKTVMVTETKGRHALLGKVLAEDIVDKKNGEVIAESKEEIRSALFNRLKN